MSGVCFCGYLIRAIVICGVYSLGSLENPSFSNSFSILLTKSYRVFRLPSIPINRVLGLSIFGKHPVPLIINLNGLKSRVILLTVSIIFETDDSVV